MYEIPNDLPFIPEDDDQFDLEAYVAWAVGAPQTPVSRKPKRKTKRTLEREAQEAWLVEAAEAIRSLNQRPAD